MVLMNNKENEEIVNLDIYRESFSDKNIGIDILNGKKYNLSNEGYNVSTAADGKSAIEIAYNISPNFIVLP